jgi:CBS-domain-containing membrane protein
VPVPIVGETGNLIGIVTEADLMRRIEAGTDRPYSWWLSMFLGDRALAADYIRSHAMHVRDIMTRDVNRGPGDTDPRDRGSLRGKSD